MQKILIVGGGLAGSCLAVQLANKGCEVKLIDSGINVSSRVAAGMINPLVFRRMTKSWRVDEYIPYAIEFYQQIEQLNNSSFFFPITIRRFFSSEQERGFWLDRQSKEAYSAYMTPVTAEDETVFPYANQFGSGRVKNSFYLNTSLLLDVLHQSDAFEFANEKVNYEQINPTAGTYNGKQFDLIVFCEGYQSKLNPWFKYLPVNSTKGETITVKTAGLSEEESLNRKCFTLHQGNGEFKVGATYIWHTDDLNLTTEGREHLLDNLRYLTDKPIEVVAQHAGVRPTTVDRRPIMGKHPDFPKLAIFNGLGTKGYMMAPLLAKEMADFIVEGKELDKESRIERFN